MVTKLGKSQTFPCVAILEVLSTPLEQREARSGQPHINNTSSEAVNRREFPLLQREANTKSGVCARQQHGCQLPTACCQKTNNKHLQMMFVVYLLREIAQGWLPIVRDQKPYHYIYTHVLQSENRFNRRIMIFVSYKGLG